MIDEWGCCSPRNIGGFLLVLIHELLQKFHVFCFSLYLTVETMLMQDLAVETKWPMFHKSDFPVVGFSECSLFFFQLVQATLSCPHAAISSHNLQDKSTSRLMKETESRRLNLLKEIKRARKVHTKQKEQNSSSVRVGTKVRIIKARLIDWKERRDMESRLRLA